jgi:hypothetical protein
MEKGWQFLIAAGLALALSCPVGQAQQMGPPPAPRYSEQASPASGPVMMLPAGQETYGSSTINPSGPAPCANCETGAARPFTPFMLGDFVGPIANQFSDVKIAEGESPRPTDRAFLKFNYFNNLEKWRWTDPYQPIHNVDLFRYTLGFEKTFFDEKISLGLRLPFYTVSGEAKDSHLMVDPSTGVTTVVPGGPGVDQTEFGNVAAILKAVLWEDRAKANLVSAGAILSFPTASSKLINPGQSIIAYMQPFGAFIYNRGDFFVQGFTSITLPLISTESIVLFNDIGVGYYAYRNPGAGCLTMVAPTMELHVATPLRQPDGLLANSGLFDGLLLHDVVDFTLGVTFEFAGKTTLGLGVAAPVTGPKPFDFEGIAQLNYRF